MGKEFWSRRIKSIKPYVPGEQPKDGEYIKLNTNENPYPPSPRVLEKIRKHNLGELRLYPDPDATRLRFALADQYGLRANQIFVGNGSDELLALSFLAFFDEERPVAFPDISYSFYPVYAKLFQVPYRVIPLDEIFQIPVETFSNAKSGIIIANPNAPTGIALSAGQIEQIVKSNSEHVVIIDEAYVDFGAESVVGLIDQCPNLLIMQTFSKSRSLAGLRIGAAFGHSDLIDALNSVKNSFNSYTLDRIAIEAATEAVLDTPYLKECCDKVIKTREYTAKLLEALGFSVLPSKANFIFAAHPRLKARWLYEKLKERGILVRHFQIPRIENYLRITIGTDDDMERLFKELEQLAGEESAI